MKPDTAFEFIRDPSKFIKDFNPAAEANKIQTQEEVKIDEESGS